MQSDGNSFCGDVVLDIAKIPFSYEDGILDLYIKSKYFLYHEYVKFLQ